MKKLLLILICLFVFSCEDDVGRSDEEFLEQIKNSKSDDLNGKKLLCNPVSVKGETLKIPLIFEFLPNFSVSTYTGSSLTYKTYITQGRYHNDLQTITIKQLNNNNYYDYLVDRQNLIIYYTSRGKNEVITDKLGKMSFFERDYFKCDLFSEDITTFFKKYHDENKKEKDNYNNKLKSKQKI